MSQFNITKKEHRKITTVILRCSNRHILLFYEEKKCYGFAVTNTNQNYAVLLANCTAKVMLFLDMHKKSCVFLQKNMIFFSSILCNVLIICYGENIFYSLKIKKHKPRFLPFVGVKGFVQRSRSFRALRG